MADRYNIVTIDDEKYFHAGLDKLIDWEDLGYNRIGEAYNGAEGLALIREKRPHLIITDIRMPVMDGLQMLEELSGDSYKPLVIIVSGHSDFTYAQQAMRYGVQHYVLKPVDEDELSQVLGEARLEIDRQEEEIKRESVEYRYTCSALIRKLISGADNALFIQEAQSILKLNGGVCYGILSFPSSEVHELSEGETVLRHLIWEKGIFGCLDRIYTEAPGVYGVIFDDADFSGGEEELLSWLLQNLNQHWGGLPVLALGERFDNLADLKISYHEAKTALASHFHRDNRGGLVRYDGKDTGMDRIIKRAIFFPDLLEGVENSDTRQIDAALDSQFGEFRRRHSAPEVINLWLKCLAIDLSRVIVELDGRPDEEISAFQRYHFEPDRTGREKLREYVRGICLRGAAILEELRRINKTGVIRPILEYLKRDFTGDVSLKAMGERFDMNPVYLGQLFKNTMGMSFRNYVRDLRMDEACRLLNRTDLKVYEVARSVGYSDCDYFSRQFEQTRGTTPGEYRKKKKNL